MEWQGPEPDRTESLMFIYDGGIADDRLIRLATDELAGYGFVAAPNLDGYLSPRLARRMRAALVGLEGRLVEMEHGTVVPATAAFVVPAAKPPEEPSAPAAAAS